jgi:hypothetical protein
MADETSMDTLYELASYVTIWWHECNSKLLKFYLNSGITTWLTKLLINADD